MRNLINKLYYSKFLGRIFHTLNHCLQQELRDCQSVLDLGCGSDSPIKNCNVPYSVGVDVFKPYLEKSKKKKIHSEYILGNITNVEFPSKSFDAVVMIEVLEHLPENVGLEILKKGEKWARKKIIISTPNGFIPQKEIDNNPYQEHISAWDLGKIQKLGYKCRGLAGLKHLRKERQDNANEADFLSSIRFWPPSFWFIVSTLSQIIVYYMPSFAFELFSVKNTTKKNGSKCFYH